MRSFRTGWAMFAALAIVAMLCQASMAQREEGRQGRGRGGPGGPGGGGMSGMRLATLEPVEKALNLTDEQKSKIKDLNDQMRDDMRKAFGDGGGGREKMQELAAGTAAKLNAILDDTQKKRLMGILVQVAGAASTADPAVAKELSITEDQKKKLDELRQSNMQEMRDMLQGARDQQGGREEMRAKLEKFREESNTKMMAVLTSEQQAKLESLKGEKVDVDLSALRGPGGPGGGRGGDRPRGERGRGERNPESKSK